jgi:DNA-binding IclR family transcriptional regulator
MGRGEVENIPAELKRIHKRKYEIMDSLQVSNVTNLSTPIFGRWVASSQSSSRPTSSTLTSGMLQTRRLR